MAKDPDATLAQTENPRATRVLSVIAESALANVVDLTLRHGNYSRRSAGSVSEARPIIETWKPHLLLLDIDAENGSAIRLIDEADHKRGVAVIWPFFAVIPFLVIPPIWVMIRRIGFEKQRWEESDVSGSSGTSNDSEDDDD